MARILFFKKFYRFIYSTATRFRPPPFFESGTFEDSKIKYYGAYFIF